MQCCYSIREETFSANQTFSDPKSKNFPVKLQTIPDRERLLPDVFRARTGHELSMSMSRSVVNNQLLKMEKYAKDNSI